VFLIPWICLSCLDVNGSSVSGTQNNKRRVFPDPNVPKGTRKGENNPDRNQMDHVSEELSSDEIDEPIPTAAESSTVDSSGKKKKGKMWSFGRKN